MPDHYLMNTKIRIAKVSARLALGIVWLYEGLVPKILFLRADEIELVRKSGLFWRSPAWTLLVMGLAQIAVGFWLIIGWTERAAVCFATIWMFILILLVAGGNPGMLIDPVRRAHQRSLPRGVRHHRVDALR